MQLAIRFCAPEVGTFSTRAQLQFNNIAMNATEITLNGSAHEPALSMDLKGILAFRPTCTGAASQRTVVLHNPSRVPAGFVYLLSDKLSDVVSVSPKSGILQGGESLSTTWTFAPLAKKSYDSKAVCVMVSPKLLKRLGARANSAAYSMFPDDAHKMMMKVAAEGTSGAEVGCASGNHF